MLRSAAMPTLGLFLHTFEAPRTDARWIPALRLTARFKRLIARFK
jgi:hypothetical protein